MLEVKQKRASRETLASSLAGQSNAFLRARYENSCSVSVLDFEALSPVLLLGRDKYIGCSREPSRVFSICKNFSRKLDSRYMPTKKKTPTHAERGRLGGKATLRRHGKKHYRLLAKKMNAKLGPGLGQGKGRVSLVDKSKKPTK